MNHEPIEYKRHMAAALIALKELDFLDLLEVGPAGTLIVHMVEATRIIAPIMSENPDKLARRLLRELPTGHLFERRADRILDAYLGNAYCFNTLKYEEDEILACRDYGNWLKPLFESIDRLATPLHEKEAA